MFVIPLLECNEHWMPEIQRQICEWFKLIMKDAKICTIMNESGDKYVFAELRNGVYKKRIEEAKRDDSSLHLFPCIFTILHSLLHEIVVLETAIHTGCWKCIANWKGEVVLWPSDTIQ